MKNLSGDSQALITNRKNISSRISIASKAGGEKQNISENRISFHDVAGYSPNNEGRHSLPAKIDASRAIQHSPGENRAALFYFRTFTRDTNRKYASFGMKKAVLFASVLFVLSVEGQVVYEDINNTWIYEFLDELANLKVIEINSVVKPYSRQYIAEKLKEAIERTGAQAGETLQQRQVGGAGTVAFPLPNRRQQRRQIGRASCRERV